MKSLSPILIFLLMFSCQNKDATQPKMQTFVAYHEWRERINGCCDFTTMLQINGNKFQYYYFNNQGDYDTTDVISGEVKKENDSVFSLVPKKDSVNQTFDYDAAEFFKNKFTRTKNGLKFGKNMLAERRFSDKSHYTLKQVYLGDTNLKESFTLRKDSIIYDKSEIPYNGDKPVEIHKKLKLSSAQRAEIDSVFDNNFWNKKEYYGAEESYGATVGWGNQEYRLSPNHVINDYFFINLKQKMKLDR